MSEDKLDQISLSTLLSCLDGLNLNELNEVDESGIAIERLVANKHELVGPKEAAQRTTGLNKSALASESIPRG